MNNHSHTREHEKPPRYAFEDPAALQWGAKLMQSWLERRRRRLAAQAESAVPPQHGTAEGGDHDAT